MIGIYGMGDPTPRDIEAVDRALGRLFDDEVPGPEQQAQLWQRIEASLGPQSTPWYRRFRGGSGWLLPGRRLALVGATAAVLIGAVLFVPSLGDNSASAAILEAVDDLSTTTSAALSDDDLTASELAELRERADALLDRLQDDPAALAALDLTDLAAAIESLQAVEALLVDGPTRVNASPVVARVAQATQQAEDALKDRDPGSPLLAATVLSGDGSGGTTAVEPGRRSFAVSDAGSVILEVRDGSLHLVAVRPAAGWIALPVEAEPTEIEVRFESAAGTEYEFEAELEDGLLVTAVDGSGGSGSSGSGSGNGATVTSTPAATATAGATPTPNTTPTPAATAPPGTTGTPVANTTVRGTLEVGTAGAQSIEVGEGGTVVLDVSVGMALVSATPDAGWTIVRQEVEEDRIDLRFRRDATEWRLDARLDDGRIEYEVSRHLNEDVADSSDGNG